MTNQIDALKLALEALETGWSPTYTGLDAREMGMKAITAIKQALKAVQEPVQNIEHCIWARNGNTPCPHTTPPAAPVQEPVAWDRPIIYTPPHMAPPAAQRFWVDMPELQLMGAYEDEQQGRWGDHVRGLLNVQAKLKEKNNG